MSLPTDTCIFHISTRGAAAALRQLPAYQAPSLASEGFIHFSRAHQVHGVVRAFYAGKSDLALLVVDAGLLSSPLKYEAPAHPAGAGDPAEIPSDQLFPHLYGPLNTSAIVDVVDVARFDGKPVHPDTAAMLRHYRFDRLPVEGTLYRSTWRSQENAGPLSDVLGGGGGPAGTAMIGLYSESPESLSCFHRLAYDEVWHVYGGDPFVLVLLRPDGRSEEVLMGTNPAAGQRVQCVVPAGVWQAGSLVPGGRYALFGCTMAPGFTGGCFEAGIAAELIAQYPAQAQTIRRLAVNGNEQHMPAGFAS